MLLTPEAVPDGAGASDKTEQASVPDQDQDRKPCSQYTDDDLEEYAFGRVTGEDLERLEEHLLVCERCQASLEQIDQFIRDFRKAASEPNGKAGRNATPKLRAAAAAAAGGAARRDAGRSA